MDMHPLVVEVFGGWGNEAQFSRVAKKLASQSKRFWPEVFVVFNTLPPWHNTDGPECKSFVARSRPCEVVICLL